ncbi:MAG: hypothetical protein BM559_06175 [Roseobacter sp. MedPE-SWchi]|nr:MAG: hypothetical protein BM559_06175 [Roseobacter sp. MedPE-SWchi]
MIQEHGVDPSERECLFVLLILSGPRIGTEMGQGCGQFRSWALFWRQKWIFPGFVNLLERWLEDSLRISSKFEVSKCDRKK